ncbi:MAG: response regulator transcription factor [Aeoliella sp.]
MQNLQFIVALDASARFVHLFLADKVDLPIDCEELIGKPLGKYAANEPDSRRLRATFAECLFTGDPQECLITTGGGECYRFRFERVTHECNHTLRSDDEVVAIAVITRLPDEVKITKREQQIVKLICRDWSSAEIARELKIKASTIETHRQNIRQKLGANGTAGLVLYGVRHGLVD